MQTPAEECKEKARKTDCVPWLLYFFTLHSFLPKQRNFCFSFENLLQTVVDPGALGIVKTKPRIWYYFVSLCVSSIDVTLFKKTENMNRVSIEF